MKTLATRNITKIDKHKKMEQHFFNGTQNRHEHYQNLQILKTEQHFYDGGQNRTQLHFDNRSNKHTQTQQRSNEPQNSARKILTKIFNQQLASFYYF